MGTFNLSNLTPQNSPGCPLGTFVQWTNIALGQSPVSGYSVERWWSNALGNNIWSYNPSFGVSMAADFDIQAQYQQCRPQQINISPVGAATAVITLNPANSYNCPVGQFIGSAGWITITATAPGGYTFSQYSSNGISGTPTSSNPVNYNIGGSFYLTPLTVTFT
jgi:hypothetical protein